MLIVYGGMHVMQALCSPRARGRTCAGLPEQAAWSSCRQAQACCLTASELLPSARLPTTWPSKPERPLAAGAAWLNWASRSQDSCAGLRLLHTLIL